MKPFNNILHSIRKAIQNAHWSKLLTPHEKYHQTGWKTYGHMVVSFESASKCDDNYIWKITWPRQIRKTVNQSFNLHILKNQIIKRLEVRSEFDRWPDIIEVGNKVFCQGCCSCEEPKQSEKRGIRVKSFSNENFEQWISDSHAVARGRLHLPRIEVKDLISETSLLFQDSFAWVDDTQMTQYKLHCHGGIFSLLSLPIYDFYINLTLFHIVILQNSFCISWL